MGNTNVFLGSAARTSSFKGKAVGSTTCKSPRKRGNLLTGCAAFKVFQLFVVFSLLTTSVRAMISCDQAREYNKSKELVWFRFPEAPLPCTNPSRIRLPQGGPGP